MAREPTKSTDPVMILNVQSFLHDRLQRLSPGPELLDDWERFHESYDRIIRRFAMACGMQDCDIDECSQDVWVAVVNGLKTFQLDSSRARFRSWLYGIVKNKAADLVRDRVKHSTVSLNDSSRTFDLEDDLPSPTQNIEATWRSEILREALAVLKTKVKRRDFAIFVDRTIRKKSGADVAAANDMTEGAVRVVDHRLRKQLQDTINHLTDGQMIASFT